MLEFESKYYQKGIQLVAGVDEAGRGPLAGPVVAAAVILPVDCELPGVRDSKKISAKKREKLFLNIEKQALSVGIGIVHEREIDRINILQATYQAMKIAIGSLTPQPEIILVDGKPADLPMYQQESIIGGDDKSLSIASASIIAKVTRDKIMENYSLVYPEYGFESNKGYGTRQHLEAIREFGSTPIHRKSFNPVKKYLPTFADLKDKQILGRLGEQLAASGIVKSGYQILEMNYRYSNVGEIDIIHIEKDEIVFSEVKSGFAGGEWGDPLDQIDEKKRDRIVAASNEYLVEKEIDQHIRFDVISVQFSKIKPIIKRIKGGLAVV